MSCLRPSSVPVTPALRAPSKLGASTEDSPGAGRGWGMLALRCPPARPAQCPHAQGSTPPPRPPPIPLASHRLWGPTHLMGPSFLSPGRSDSPSPQLPGPEPRGALPSCPRSLSCVQGNRRSWATLTARARRDTRTPQGKDPEAVTQAPAGPGLGCGPGSGLTLRGCAPRAARPVPPPFQKHFPTGTAGFWPVGDSGLQAERGAGRREQA